MKITVDNLPAFNKSLARLMTEADSDAVEVLKKVSFDTFRNLQNKTPRDTGRARAGWNVNVDTPPSEWKPAKGAKSYTRKRFTSAAKIKFDSVINLTNNVEYIVPLDEGYSRQATMGMMQPVITRMYVLMEKALLAKSNRKIKG